MVVASCAFAYEKREGEREGRGKRMDRIFCEGSSQRDHSV